MRYKCYESLAHLIHNECEIQLLQKLYEPRIGFCSFCFADHHLHGNFGFLCSLLRVFYVSNNNEFN